MRAIVPFVLALSCGVASAADAPKPVSPCKVLKTRTGQVLKDSKGHALRTCTVTADSIITADSSMPTNSRYLATEDGKPIKTEDGHYILLEDAATK